MPDHHIFFGFVVAPPYVDKSHSLRESNGDLKGQTDMTTVVEFEIRPDKGKGKSAPLLWDIDGMGQAFSVGEASWPLHLLGSREPTLTVLAKAAATVRADDDGVPQDTVHMPVSVL